MVNKIFDKVDRELLDSSNRIVKRWNWLTGKDQFFLSKIFLVTGFVLSCLATVFFCIEIEIWWSGLFTLLVPILYFDVYIAVLCVEKIKPIEQDLGAKLKVLEHLLRKERRFNFHLFLIFILICFCFFIFIKSFELLDSLLGFATWGCPTLTATSIYYLLSVDQPPFKKSQVFEWTKSLFRVSVPAVSGVSA